MAERIPRPAAGARRTPVLVKLEPDALHFSGLSFYRQDDDHIDAYIVLRNGDEISEHELKYVRD